MLHWEPPCQFPRASQNCSCSEVRILQGSGGRLAVLFTCQEQVGETRSLPWVIQPVSK